MKNIKYIPFDPINQYQTLTQSISLINVIFK